VPDTASVDYIDEEGQAKPRHIFRLAAMAEKPIPVYVNDGLSDEYQLDRGLSTPMASG
jgi:hypothetical protein